MLGYYSKSICKLLDEIHCLKKQPFNDIQSWKRIQLSLVKKNIYIENKIRLTNKSIKDLNFYRKNPQQILSKIESNKIKNKLARLKVRLEDLRYVLKVYKSVGDAIAFTFINKLDIKPQNFKQSAGFISEKEGLVQELIEFKKAYKTNIVAILNDLTSSLKYCDITLCTSNGLFFPLEVKSSDAKNSRIERQEKNAEKVFKYLREDVVENLYGNEGIMQRHELGSKEINHVLKLNQAIEVSKINGYEFISVEKGLSYLVAHNHKKDFRNKLDEHVKSNFKKPMPFSLNEMKFLDQGHYPFSLSLFDPKNYLDFLKGNYVIMVFVDYNIIEKLSKKYKFKVDFVEFPYIFKFESLDKNSPLSSFIMSEHMFLRIVLEFVSLDWMFKDTFNRFSERGLVKLTNNS